MPTDVDDLLAELCLALPEPPAAVGERMLGGVLAAWAPPRRRRSRVLAPRALLVAALIVLVGGSLAYAIGGRVVDAVTGGAAPPRIKHDLASMANGHGGPRDGAPPWEQQLMRSNGKVVKGSARRVLTIPTRWHRSASLYVARTTSRRLLLARGMGEVRPRRRMRAERAVHRPRPTDRTRHALHEAWTRPLQRSRPESECRLDPHPVPPRTLHRRAPAVGLVPLRGSRRPSARRQQPGDVDRCARRRRQPDQHLRRPVQVARTETALHRARSIEHPAARERRAAQQGRYRHDLECARCGWPSVLPASPQRQEPAVPDLAMHPRGRPLRLRDAHRGAPPGGPARRGVMADGPTQRSSARRGLRLRLRVRLGRTQRGPTRPALPGRTRDLDPTRSARLSLRRPTGELAGWPPAEHPDRLRHRRPSGVPPVPLSPSSTASTPATTPSASTSAWALADGRAEGRSREITTSVRLILVQARQ